jgi:hypothetical protein
MDVCLLCVFVFSGRVLCDELITRPEESTDCGASLCVIKKPRERGGHSPRWASEPEKIKQMILANSTNDSCHFSPFSQSYLSSFFSGLHFDCTISSM